MQVDNRWIDTSRISLEGLLNTRDLGGCPAAGGLRVRSGRLLRSGMLARAKGRDIEILKAEYGLRTVVDFRTPTEASQMPDPAIEGVRYVSAPLLDEENLGVTREAKVDFTDYVGQMLFYVKTAGTDIGAYFEKTYPAIATGEGAMRQLRRFFDVLLEQEEGAVLYHCTAGKDRVGTATALLLSALGVPRELIVEDFLFTNACLREETEGMMRAAAARTEDEAAVHALAMLNSVRASYLEAVFAAIEARFGSVEAYLSDCMGLTDERLAKLRSMYLA